MSRPLGTRTIKCAECGATVTGAMSNRRRYCSSDCLSSVKRRSRAGKTYRKLARGEQLPTGQPLRYKTNHGYIMLRWTIDPSTFVEVAEHRVFDGRNSTAEEVHHINYIRDDNRRENLMEVTSKQHQAIHRAEDRRRAREMAKLYESGMTTTEIASHLEVNPATVSRALVRQGTATRGGSDYARTLDASEVVRRFKSGEGATSIRKDLGVSYDRVMRVLDENGVPRRGPGRVPVAVTS